MRQLRSDGSQTDELDIRAGKTRMHAFREKAPVLNVYPFVSGKKSDDYPELQPAGGGCLGREAQFRSRIE